MTVRKRDRKKVKKKAKKQAAKTPLRSRTPTARGKRGFNAEEYVRKVAQQAKTGGCKVCCYPNVKKKLDDIFEQMDAQKVKISGAQLLRDLKKHYDNFRCTDTKFRDHIRDCLGRDL